MSNNHVTENIARKTGALALEGVRVVECGGGVAAAFATKLMALLGAEVIKVEPPQGDVVRRRGPFFEDKFDSEKSGLFLYLNADKYGVTFDLGSAVDRARLDGLLESSDVLIHNILPADRANLRMNSATIAADHPDLIVTAISPYGANGPRANYRAYIST